MRRLLARAFPVGTRSVLFGAHCAFIHPLIVAVAWWRLYGAPLDPRLWVAFIVHDLGYWGKPNMDGPEGETHPEWGARTMSLLFDRRRQHLVASPADPAHVLRLGRWGLLTLLHSRYYARAAHRAPSRLCVADKYAIVIEPIWAYLPRVWLTGEYREYFAKAAAMARHEPVTGAEAAGMGAYALLAWCRGMRSYTRRWVEAHKGGAADRWTSANVSAVASSIDRRTPSVLQ